MVTKHEAFAAYMAAIKAEEEEGGSIRADICEGHSSREAGFVVNRAGQPLEGEAPVLVMCPGTHGDDLALFQLIKVLGEHYTIYSVRYRHDPPHSCKQYAADVTEAIEYLNLNKFHLVGESLGSIPVFQIAAQLPDATQSLTLAGGFCHRVKPGLSTIWRHILPFIPISLLGVACKRVLPRSVIRNDSGFPPYIAASYNALLNRDQLRIVSQRIGMIERWDFRAYLESLHIPVLYLGGSRDLLVPVRRQSRLMMQKLPRCRVEILKGVSHPLLVTHPERCAKILLAFWNEAGV